MKPKNKEELERTKKRFKQVGIGILIFVIIISFLLLITK
jgi:hypothetical protein